MLTLLDRYLLRSVLFAAAGAILFFSSIIAAVNALRDLLGYLLDGILPFQTVAYLVALLFPFVLTYALPMGLLTGVLLVLGRLSADNEITAMRAAGLSLGRIGAPVLALATLGFGAALLVNFEYLPRARVVYHQALDSAVHTNPLGFLVPKTFIRSIPRVIVYVSKKEGNTATDFWLWQLDRQSRVIRTTHARTAEFSLDPAQQQLVLTLRDVQIEDRPAGDPEQLATPGHFGSAQEMSLRFDTESIFGKPLPRQEIAWMTLGQLRAEDRRIASEPESGKRTAERVRLKMTVQDKIASAFSVLCFTLLGVPLGIRTQRKETSANLGVALLIMMAHYFLTFMATRLSTYPALHPEWLLWIPDLLVLGLGIALFRRI
ncbi:YjgP/YjgQ family permease [Opitutaceae bacterium EW11]|nr:YjgP/YjgQ family permease [Opitutaceae bacterium EW11]